MFLYNQQDILGQSITFLFSPSLKTNSQPVSVNPIFTEGIIECIDSTGKIIPLHTTRHAIAPGQPSGGYLFIYKCLEADHTSTGSYAQLRELSEHLLNVRETERTRIAREIHDELGQQLTILKMDLSWLNQKLKKCEDASVLQKTGDALKVLNETIKSVRRIATELRPSMLDDLGLTEAIEWQSKEFEKRWGIRIIFESDSSYIPVDNDVATSLFRIYQEALTNIARHANASSVKVNLKSLGEYILMRIVDNGTGIDLNKIKNGNSLGILGMRERSRLIGGKLNIFEGNKGGTTVELTFPLAINYPK